MEAAQVWHWDFSLINKASGINLSVQTMYGKTTMESYTKLIKKVNRVWKELPYIGCIFESTLIPMDMFYNTASLRERNNCHAFS